MPVHSTPMLSTLSYRRVVSRRKNGRYIRKEIFGNHDRHLGYFFIFWAMGFLPFLLKLLCLNIPLGRVIEPVWPITGKLDQLGFFYCLRFSHDRFLVSFFRIDFFVFSFTTCSGSLAFVGVSAAHLFATSGVLTNIHFR